MNRKKRKLAIIGTVGLPAKYGGFETLANHLVENLQDDYDMTVYCSGKKYLRDQRIKSYKGARLVYLPFDANGVQSIIYDTFSILHALWYAEVLLILGVAGAWVLPFVKLLTNKKIVISIDGIEWKRDKWSLPAKLYLYWAEKIAVKYSHVDISDNESIQDYTAMRYGSLSNVIEYGADHTMQVTPNLEDLRQYPFLSKPYAFKVCRIEPENNIDMVLEVFANNAKYPLVMVGNWRNSSYGQQLKERYSKNQYLILLDPVYEQRSIDLLRSNATLYVHGHSAGGTNPSLVEAMYLGLPIFAYGISYNKTTTEQKAKYFMTEQDLIHLIKNVDGLELQKLGHTMLEIAQCRYRWDVIARKYHAIILKAFEVNVKSQVVPAYKSLGPQLLRQYEANHLAYHNLFFETSNN
jgi:glycosyltransferase involved in cell wall biosynthesis